MWFNILKDLSFIEKVKEIFDARMKNERWSIIRRYDWGSLEIKFFSDKNGEITKYEIFTRFIDVKGGKRSSGIAALEVHSKDVFLRNLKVVDNKLTQVYRFSAGNKREDYIFPPFFYNSEQIDLNNFIMKELEQ